MRRSILAWLLGMVLILGAWGSAQAQGSKWIATPGVGVGPVKLGMTAGAIEKSVTRTPGGDHQLIMGNPKWVYYDQGVQVHYDSAVKALQVVVDKSGIATPEGVQLGDPTSRFEQVYGRDYLAHQLPTAAKKPKQYYYAYKSRGIGFQTEGDRIILIYIFPK